MTDAVPLLQLSGVTKSYGGGVVNEVLHGIDLVLRPGEFTALVGPSGSGKSTLLNILGLLDRPTAGRIMINGRDTSGLDENELTRLRGRTLGFVFQFHHLLTAFTAAENVMLPMIADRGRSAPEFAARARDLLVRIGLGQFIGRRADQLSGGQQQRVAIARALAMNPALVLADEPTGNLDSESSDQVFTLLEQIAGNRGAAFLLVTHDQRLAARCSRQIELVDGRIVRDQLTPAAT